MLANADDANSVDGSRLTSSSTADAVEVTAVNSANPARLCGISRAIL